MFSACKQQQSCAVGCMLHFQEEGFTLYLLKIHLNWELWASCARKESLFLSGFLTGTLRECWPLILLHVHQLWLRYCYKRKGGSEWEGERWNYCNMISEQLKCGGKRNSFYSTTLSHTPVPMASQALLWPLTPGLCQWRVSVLLFLSFSIALSMLLLLLYLACH